MPLLLNALIIVIASCAAGWFFTWLIRIVASRLNVVDRPDPSNPRKIHTRVTPLLGGWALFLTFGLITLTLVASGIVPDAKVSVDLLVSFFIAGAVLMIGGYIDDAWRAPWFVTIIFPIMAAAIMSGRGLSVSYITNPLGGLIYVDAWPAVVTGSLVFLWLLGMSYTTKLLDGLDGLATTIGAVASFVIFIVSLFWDDRGSTTTYLSVAFLGVLLGFLIWNWHPAKIFLGESGSTFIGFTLGVVAVLTGGKIATALLVMGIPILDVVWVIFRRLTSRQQVSLADAGHLHFRLLRLGWSQRKVVLILASISLLFGSVSFFTTSIGKIIALIVLVIIMVIAGLYIVRRQKSYENPVS